MSFFFFFSSRRRHTRFSRDWSSDVCSSDLPGARSTRELTIHDSFTDYSQTPTILAFPTMKPFNLKLLLCCAALTLPTCFAEGEASDLEKLKAQLAEQQHQIESLKKSLVETERMIENLSRAQEDTKAAVDSALAAASRPAPAPASAANPAPGVNRIGGDIASTTPVLSPPPAAPARPNIYSPQDAVPSSPLQLQLGNITITPVGFMDMTAVWRNENAGSGIGSSFGSVPYNNTNAAHLTEFRFSPQNSRL